MPFCPHCGTEHAGDGNFCGVCGRGLTPAAEHAEAAAPPPAPPAAAPASPPPPPAPPPADPATPALRGTPTMLLAGLAVAAVAAVAAVFLFASRGDDTPGISDALTPLPEGGAPSLAGVDQSGSAVTLDAADEQLLVELAAAPPAFNAEATASITNALVALNVPSAANDREEMRGLIGPPDAFDLTFEADPREPAAPLLRVETWHYFDFGSAFVFVDGRLANSFPVEDLGEIALLPLQYDPAAFTRTMTPEQAAALIDDPTAGSIIDFDTADVGADLDVYAGPQILLMFDADGLAAVSTLPLTPSDD